MKRLLLIAGALVFFATAPSGGEGSGQDWKQEIAGDKEAIMAQRDTIKEHISTAKQEEGQLREQIHAAKQSGDTATAQQLMEQLKETRQANFEEMRQDKQAMRSAKEEFRQDRKEARIDRMDKNDDGTVDRAEHERFKQLQGRRDIDNNPPGPRGGPGTDWENPPGPKGGPGTSPDRRDWKDKDNNPPGPRGGRGTNWENRPGPQGGPGASPDKINRGARDHGQGQGRGGRGQGGEHRGGGGPKGAGGPRGGGKT